MKGGAKLCNPQVDVLRVELANKKAAVGNAMESSMRHPP